MVSRSYKFVVDTMLGDLARWLRILGYDTLYSRSYSDWQVLRIAEKGNRIIITMDKGLCRKAQRHGLRCVLIESFDIREKLAELHIKVGIELVADPSKSRCPECNGALRKVYDKNIVKDRVPPNALEIHSVFYVCTRCGRVYWEGSHWRNIRKILDEVRDASAKLKLRFRRSIGIEG